MTSSQSLGLILAATLALFVVSITAYVEITPLAGEAIAAGREARAQSLPAEMGEAKLRQLLLLEARQVDALAITALNSSRAVRYLALAVLGIGVLHGVGIFYLWRSRAR